ncbi:MAG: MgtC/SapB family protein [Dictyoglomus thermophilum]|uniref:MgtC/SapB family protein n=1 Tax=Dictyoglomus thermophilum TaxID=14 RepID=UPI0011EA81DE|nr:MgtC/SapB family protein [Dictyoglomus thermophilum]MCX7720852.1 MgtC/SapB family protein [Dictyoglomus thermophilum]TYT24010.1 MgtC/SapB family protein [Dictyoglomus thermophilum]
MITVWDVLIKFLLSTIFSGIIGWEREKEEKPAGLRTHILVSLGSTLFMIVSAYAFPGESDPGRIAAQVVTGIGFIGAGTILRTGFTVKGLTTAASIWAVSGVGLAVGAGLYFPAFVSTLFIISVLVLATKLEKIFLGTHQDVALNLIIEDRPGSIGEIGTLFGELNIDIKQIELGNSWGGKVSLKILVRLPQKISKNDLLLRLSRLPSVVDAEII